MTNAPEQNEFVWETLSDTKPNRTSNFDYGFDRFPAPKDGEDGKPLYAAKVYTKTYKAVSNALAKYLSDLEASSEGKEVELPVFKRQIIKDAEKKPIGVKVFRIK